VVEPDTVLAEAMAASSYAIGEERFRMEVEDRVRAQSRQSSTPSDLGLPSEPSLPVQDLAVAVADAFNIELKDLCRPRSRVGWARAVLLDLACTIGGLRQRAAAHALGALSEHAVSKQRRLLHAALPHDAELRRRVEMLRQTLKSKV
jgi:hypothetical protein